MGGPRGWSDAQDLELVELRAKGFSWDKIAYLTGRHKDTCRLRFEVLAARPQYRDRAAAAKLVPAAKINCVHTADRASDQLLHDRDQRFAAMDRRSITATVWGDPAPGYSALYRKQVTDRIGCAS
jgi:hypothetical protein